MCVGLAEEAAEATGDAESGVKIGADDELAFDVEEFGGEGLGIGAERGPGGLIEGEREGTEDVGVAALRVEFAEVEDGAGTEVAGGRGIDRGEGAEPEGDHDHHPR